MYEMTEQHIEVLERLHQSSATIEVLDNEWDSCHKTEMAQLRGSGYIDASDDGNWYITIKGTGCRIDYRNKQGQFRGNGSK
jgi:hypothetical protein